MIFEYAVSPNLFSNKEGIKFLRQSFGIDEGRLISEIPKKKWKQIVLQKINDSENPPVMKKSLKEATRKIFKSGVLYKRDTLPKEIFSQWLDYAIIVHGERAFRAIIIDPTESCSQSNSFVLSADLELFDSTLWKNPKDIIVERNAKTMINTIKPLIDCSGEILLIDRNFRPNVLRFRNVLFEIIDIVLKRKYSPFVKKISYHVGDQYSETLKKDCERYIKNELPSGFKVEITIWPKEELHDRFILTNIGGVSFGQGLDEFHGHGPKDIRISLLSSLTYQNLWKKFKTKETNFSF